MFSYQNERVMSKQIDHIVRQLISEHEGGESFFDALDDAIREDRNFCEQLFNMATDTPRCNLKETLIVGSGKFAKVFDDWLKSKHYKIQFLPLQGNLRELFNINVVDEIKEKLVSFPNIKNAVIIDDSFFSGKTIQSIVVALYTAGIDTLGACVVYDGSKTKYDKLNSLFRYYA